MAGRIASTVHFLKDTDQAPEVGYVQERMREEYGREVVDDRISWTVFARHSIVIDKCRGAESVLDVGVGQGNFINALSQVEGIERLVGVDIKKYELFTEMGDFEFRLMDVTELDFADGEFEVVSAQEMLEHLPDEQFHLALAQLRRVARRKLIVTVPFCEPLPLIPGHFQQFTPDRVQELFPRARYELLLKHPVSSVPWILIEEVYGEDGGGEDVKTALQTLRYQLGIEGRIRASQARNWVRHHPGVHRVVKPIVSALRMAKRGFRDLSRRG